MSSLARNPVTGVTKKQEEFCFQLVKIGIPSRAYRIAYENTTMSDAAVRVEVSRLMKDPKIEDRIADFQAVAARALDVSIERIAQELARIGFADPGMLYDDQGMPIPLHMLPEDIRRAVQSITIVERKGGMAINVALKKDATKDEKRVAKSQARQKAQGEVESVTSIEYVPMREKKITLHDKQPALQTMARWKKMIQDKPADGEMDANDVRNLTDEQLEAEIRANNAALETAAAIRKASKKVPIAKAK